MKALLYGASRRLALLGDWFVAQVALSVLRALRLLPVDRALDIADRAARRLGPHLPRHRIAIGNLRAAYPDKSAAEVEAIASDMWGNMARLATEYVFLDKLFDYEPAAMLPGRIEVSGKEHFLRIANGNRATILFTAHLGNFELLPVAGAEIGMEITSLFRPPNNRFVADYILSTRRSTMGGLLPSARGATFTLSRILDEGGNVGVLVDQRFRHGLRTTFFGRPCETSPLLPKLARHHDCDVYPARCIRLPGNRFRLKIEDRIDLPRDTGGRVDATATAQLLNDIVERWVREDPGQWTWFHNRWDVMKNPKRDPRRSRRGRL